MYGQLPARSYIERLCTQRWGAFTVSGLSAGGFWRSYALSVGALSLCLGYLPAGFGVPPLILLGVGLGVALVWGLGRTGETSDS